MTAIKTYFFAPILCMLVLTANVANAGDKPVRELYVKSGMQHHLAQMPATVLAGLDETAQSDSDLRKLPKELQSEIKGVVARSFAADKLDGIILRELEAKMSEKEMRAVLKWLESPLGIKCTQLEIAESDPDAMARVEAYAEELKKTPPAPQRLKLARQFDETAKLTETAAVIMVGVEIASVAVHMPFVPFNPDEGPNPLAGIARKMEEQRPKLEAALEPFITAEILLTYRSLSAAELKRYIQFMASAAGKKFNDASMAAVQKAIFEGATECLQGVAKIVENANRKSEA